MVFEIEITKFLPQPTREQFTCETSEDAARHVQLNDVEECVIFVAALDRARKADFGNFYVFCNAERASVVVHEHREHYAVDPQLWPDESRDLSFRGEDGCHFLFPISTPFRVPKHWLPCHFGFPLSSAFLN